MAFVSIATVRAGSGAELGCCAGNLDIDSVQAVCLDCTKMLQTDNTNIEKKAQTLYGHLLDLYLGCVLFILKCSRSFHLIK